MFICLLVFVQSKSHVFFHCFQNLIFAFFGVDLTLMYTIIKLYTHVAYIHMNVCDFFIGLFETVKHDFKKHHEAGALFCIFQYILDG